MPEETSQSRGIFPDLPNFDALIEHAKAAAREAATEVVSDAVRQLKEALASKQIVIRFEDRP